MNALIPFQMKWFSSQLPTWCQPNYQLGVIREVESKFFFACLLTLKIFIPPYLPCLPTNANFFFQMFINIKPQTCHKLSSLLSQCVIVVCVWECSIIKEVLQGEAMCENSKGVTLLRRKWKALLLLLWGEWENIIT